MIEFWQEALPALRTRLGVSDSIESAGLSAADAARRLARCGPNTLRSHRSRAPVLQFIAQPFDEIIISIDEVSALTPTVDGYINVEPA